MTRRPFFWYFFPYVGMFPAGMIWGKGFKKPFFFISSRKLHKQSWAKKAPAKLNPRRCSGLLACCGCPTCQGPGKIKNIEEKKVSGNGMYENIRFLASEGKTSWGNSASQSRTKSLSFPRQFRPLDFVACNEIFTWNGSVQWKLFENMFEHLTWQSPPTSFCPTVGAGESRTNIFRHMSHWSTNLAQKHFAKTLHKKNLPKKFAKTFCTGPQTFHKNMSRLTKKLSKYL